MAWYIYKRFCREERYSPSFTFPDFAAFSAVSASLREGRRVDTMLSLVARRTGQQDYVSGPIPDFLTIASNHVASDGFRQVVEELEPGLHQFIPVTLYDRDDYPVARPYWLVNPHVVMDVELTSERREELRRTGRAPSREEAREQHGSRFVYAERSAIEGHHFWRISRQSMPDLYFSDELIRRVRRARLRKLSLHRVIAV
jgi:hypothetical protein